MENRGKVTVTIDYDDLVTMVLETIRRKEEKELDSDEDIVAVNVPEDIAAWIENTDNSIQILRKWMETT